jgi:chromosome partitioning protein
VTTVIALANQKGGVGKTTTAINLGASLARQHKRVLIFDFDPQANSSAGLGLRASSATTYEVVIENVPVADVAVATNVEGLWLAPAAPSLAGAEVELVPMMAREFRLRRAIDGIREAYDYVLIDCPPSLGLLTVNALVAADHALITSEAEYFSLQGVEQALEVVELAKESLHPDLDWLGVVLNIADMRLVHSREALKSLQERFESKVFDTVIRRSVRYAESAERGVSILDFAPALGADYTALADEILARLGGYDEARERLKAAIPQEALG